MSDPRTSRSSGLFFKSAALLFLGFSVKRKRNFEIITISSLYQVIDGYFAHFVAPENLPPMAKHAVFVLDVSGSMSGQKLLQVKNAMKSILDQLRDMDFFSILHFSDKVTGNCFSKTYKPYPRQ